MDRSVVWDFHRVQGGGSPFDCRALLPRDKRCFKAIGFRVGPEQQLKTLAAVVETQDENDRERVCRQTHVGVRADAPHVSAEGPSRFAGIRRDRD